MMSSLLGNKNVEKVLLFLFVNEKCYPTQLQRLLDTPLTSLQNAFFRLEKGRVVLSHYEGKTKIYRLNPVHPLMAEIELLLKKAYTLLPASEKKRYSLAQIEKGERRSQEVHLSAFWDRLKRVKHFSRNARFKPDLQKEEHRRGRGDVTISSPQDSVLIFYERGAWQMPQGATIDFTNTFRWTFDRSLCMISLEHLRLGPDNPVFLFHLICSADQTLSSLESHICEEDVYLATVPWDSKGIYLHWRVIGPKKNEQIESHYL
ncbi:MAG: winged helix-turn-helix transcriptional regulator [Chlamydiales bacterium]|nr:winged helix-turn-helix transcriptional regulator [Chlamydiales bacterium]